MIESKQTKMVIRDWAEGLIVNEIKIDVTQQNIRQFFIDTVNNIRSLKGHGWDFLVNGELTDYKLYFGPVEWHLIKGR